MESSQPDMQLLLDFGLTFKLSVIEPSENAFSFGDSAETRKRTRESSVPLMAFYTFPNCCRTSCPLRSSKLAGFGLAG